MLETKGIIEALLFTWGDPLDLKSISTILDLDESIVENLLEEMIQEFNEKERGLRIIRVNDSYQLGTRIEHFDYIKKLNNRNKKSLSNAAIETLSIIAYKQPVTKSDIDNIRGVKSDRVIETLCEKKLIEELGRLDRPGRPIIYGTNENFLRYFGLESLDNLPDIDGFE